MFEAVKEMQLFDKFNPFPLYKRYLAWGFPSDELEELITDTLVDSWLKYLEEGQRRSLAEFRAFVAIRIRGEITKRCREKNKVTIVSLNQKPVENDPDQDVDDELQIPVVDSDDIEGEMARSFLSNFEVIIDRAFPFDTSLPQPVQDSRQKKRAILLYRYARGMSWKGVAKSLGFGSFQAAQQHDKSARKAFRRFLSTPNGICACHEIMGDKLAPHFLQYVRDAIAENPDLD